MKFKICVSNRISSIKKRTAWKKLYAHNSGRLFIPVSFVGLVGEFRENRQGRVTGEAAMFAAYTSSIVESRPAPRGKGNK